MVSSQIGVFHWLKLVKITQIIIEILLMYIKDAINLARPVQAQARIAMYVIFYIILFKVYQILIDNAIILIILTIWAIIIYLVLQMELHS